MWHALVTGDPTTWRTVLVWLYFFHSIVFLIFAGVLWIFAVEIRTLKKSRSEKPRLLSGAHISDYGPHQSDVPMELLERIGRLERTVSNGAKLLGQARELLNKGEE